MPARSRIAGDVLVELAGGVSTNAHVPYSGRAEAAVVLLSSGEWIPGVRVESASFSLVIPPILNAVTTSYALGRLDVVAIAQNTPFQPEDEVYLEGLPWGPWTVRHDRLVARASNDILPQPSIRLSPFVDRHGEDAWTITGRLADHVYVPYSSFPVTCLLESVDGRWIPGVNVEHPDWNRILCAERNALGTAVSYGLCSFTSLYLLCTRDAGCTPCGACRQLLAELAPQCRIIMSRGDKTPDETSPGVLLPFGFSGKSLTNPETRKR